jgi:hypothetical protein
MTEPGDEVMRAQESDGPNLDAEPTLVTWMAELSHRLLDSLQPELKRHAHWHPMGDERVDAERVRWFYTPTDHGGVALRDLTAGQQRLAMQLLATGLTRSAYVTTCTILGLENVLDEVEGWQVDWGRERGRDPGLYWIRIFGTPGEHVWAWRFGGHHVSVNVLLQAGAVASVTPTFLGADPASSPLLAGQLRPLGGTEDLARALMLSFSTADREQALLHPRAISDIVTGNRTTVRPGDEMMHMQDLFRGALPTPRLAALVDRIDEIAETGSGYSDDDHRLMAVGSTNAGIAGRDMTSEQRSLLRSLIAAYTDRSPAPVAARHRARYAEGTELDEVHFGWAGNQNPGQPHYFRLTGPHILAEYDNTQRSANHAHSVWRDPGGDFGLDLLAAHRRANPHA